MSLLQKFTAQLFFAASKRDPDSLERRRIKEAQQENIARESFEFFQKSINTRKKIKKYHALRIRTINNENNPNSQKIAPIQKIATIDVVNDDKPFLLDSILAFLNENAVDLHLVLHPVITIETDKNGALKEIYATHGKKNHAPQTAMRKSFIHIHISPPDEDPQCTLLEKKLNEILHDVHLVVEEWSDMQKRMRNAIADFQNILQNNQRDVKGGELKESIDFLQWLLNDHFTFMGMRDYDLSGDAKNGKLTSIPKAGYGLLRDPKFKVLRKGGEMVSDTPETRRFLAKPDPYIIITKANIKSKVHRRVYMDYIAVKRFEAGGQVIGELRVIGLFTSAAYVRSPRVIPPAAPKSR